jgi:hypothetical protein
MPDKNDSMPGLYLPASSSTGGRHESDAGRYAHSGSHNPLDAPKYRAVTAAPAPSWARMD